MADDHILHAQVQQHIGGNLAGEGTGLLVVDILGAHMDVGAGALGNNIAQVGEGHTDDDLAAGVMDAGDQSLQQQTGLGGGIVHFPVAGNHGFALLFIHGKTSKIVSL